MSGPPDDSRPFTCRNCGGTAPRDASDQFRQPAGWYSLTVSVPYRTGNGKRYIWVGLFCGALCLIEYGPRLAEQEALARQGYEAVAPEYAEPVTSGGSTRGRKVPRP